MRNNAEAEVTCAEGVIYLLYLEEGRVQKVELILQDLALAFICANK